MHESRGNVGQMNPSWGFRGTYQKGQDSFSWVVLLFTTFRLAHDGVLLGAWETRHIFRVSLV
jgi:hypothetical protein